MSAPTMTEVLTSWGYTHRRAEASRKMGAHDIIDNDRRVVFTGTCFDTADWLREQGKAPSKLAPRGVRQGAPVPSPCSGEQGATLARSAELPLDLSGAAWASPGDRTSGVPTSIEGLLSSRMEARAGSGSGVRRSTKQGVHGPTSPTSLPATDGVERGGCGDVASPFTPSPFWDLFVLLLGIALAWLVWTASTPVPVLQ